MMNSLFDGIPQSIEGADFEYIQHSSGLELVAQALEKDKFIYLDTEIAVEDVESVNPFKDKIRLVQLGNEDKVFILDVFRIGNIESIRNFLEKVITGKGLVGHNLKFDIKFLYTNFGLVPKLNFDTMIASQIISKGSEGDRHSLKAIANRFSGIDIDKRLQKSDWSVGNLTRQQLEYAAEDIKVLRNLFKVVRDRLNEETDRELSGEIGRVFGIKNPVAALEMAFLPVLAEIELTGIPLDLPLLKKVLQEKEKEFQSLYLEFKKKFYIDPFSPQQVSNYLVNRLKINLPKTEKGSYSSQDTVLKNFTDYEEVRLLLNIRSIKNSLDKLKEILSYAREGRVYSEFKQIGAPTGRMSSSRPNLQNIPVGLKEVFKAQDGAVFIVADYSQIELRLAAEYTKDQKMVEAFLEGKDLHRLTASIITGKSYQDISQDERKLAKAINFGLIYGMSPKSLVEYAKANYDVDISLEDAKEFHRNFFHYYQGFYKWHNSVKEKLKNNRIVEVKTLFGRRIVASRFTDAVNYPIQGSGSDLLKMAVLLFSKQKDDSCKIVNLVHDEILVESTMSRARENAELLANSMERAGKYILKTVPVSFEISLRERWGKG